MLELCWKHVLVKLLECYSTPEGYFVFGAEVCQSGNLSCVEEGKKNREIFFKKNLVLRKERKIQRKKTK
jgi:hypothetical protein